MKEPAPNVHRAYPKYSTDFQTQVWTAPAAKFNQKVDQVQKHFLMQYFTIVVVISTTFTDMNFTQ